MAVTDIYLIKVSVKLDDCDWHIFFKSFLQYDHENVQLMSQYFSQNTQRVFKKMLFFD